MKTTSKPQAGPPAAVEIHDEGGERTGEQGARGRECRRNTVTTVSDSFDSDAEILEDSEPALRRGGARGSVGGRWPGHGRGTHPNGSSSRLEFQGLWKRCKCMRRISGNSLHCHGDFLRKLRGWPREGEGPKSWPGSDAHEGSREPEAGALMVQRTRKERDSR